MLDALGTLIRTYKKKLDVVLKSTKIQRDSSSLTENKENNM